MKYDYSKYIKYLNSLQWFYIRKRIIKRDGNKCTKCGAKKSLHVHHITYDNLFNENDEDLITLCAACHMKEHGREKPIKKKHKKKAKRKVKKRVKAIKPKKETRKQ